MFDPNLQMSAFRLREQHLLRTTEGDRLARELRRKRTSSSFLGAAIGKALAMLRVRRVRRAHANMVSTSSGRHLIPGGNALPPLTEPRELVGSGAGSSSDGSSPYAR